MNGLGQGSGYAGSGWAKIVSAAAETYNDHAYLITYFDPTLLIKAVITILGFVNDNNLALQGNQWETLFTLLE